MVHGVHGVNEDAEPESVTRSAQNNDPEAPRYQIKEK